jgi:hypothetical protein
VEVAVAGAAAQHRGPHVAVGVDEAGHGDAAAAVDQLGAGRVDVRRHVRDVRALDEHVAGLEDVVPVHGQQVRAAHEVRAHNGLLSTSRRYHGSRARVRRALAL